MSSLSSWLLCRPSGEKGWLAIAWVWWWVVGSSVGLVGWVRWLVDCFVAQHRPVSAHKHTLDQYIVDRRGHMACAREQCRVGGLRRGVHARVRSAVMTCRSWACRCVVVPWWRANPRWVCTGAIPLVAPSRFVHTRGRVNASDDGCCGGRQIDKRRNKGLTNILLCYCIHVVLLTPRRKWLMPRSFFASRSYG